MTIPARGECLEQCQYLQYASFPTILTSLIGRLGVIQRNK